MGAVIANEVIATATLTLPLARGNATGIFRLADRTADTTTNGGIVVTASLNGTVVMTTVTQADGTYTFPFPGLPENIGSERYPHRAGK